MNSLPVPTRRPKRWPWVVGGAVAFLAIIYFVATSGPFIRGVVLPRVGDTLGADLTADRVALSPFSSLELQGVKLVPRGAEPLVSVGTVRVRYGLLDVIGGRIRADEVTIENPVVTIVEKADGTSNLGRLLDGLPKSSTSQPSPQGTAPRLAIANVRLSGGAVTITRPGPGTGTETMGLRDLAIGLDRLANGQAGRLTVSAEAAMDSGTNRLRSRLGGDLQVGLTESAAPDRVEGSLQFSVGEAGGEWSQLAGLAAQLGVDVTQTEIRSVRLEFSQNDNALGRVSLQGTYDAGKTEAQVNYEVGGIDRRVLALAGAALGIDFRQTAVEARGRIDIAQRGGVASSFGAVQLSRLSVDLGQGGSPELDVQTDYKVTFDSTRKTLLVDTLKLEARQGGRMVLTGGLDRPMNLAWDQAAPGFRESTLSLQLTEFQLGEWRSILGGSVPGGRVSADVQVRAERDGRLLQVTLGAKADQLAPASGGDSLRDAVLAVAVQASVEDFSSLEVSRYSLDVTRPDGPLVSVSGVGDWHTTQQGGGIQASVNGSIPPLLALVPIEGLSSEGGKVSVTARVAMADGKTDLAVKFGVDGFTGLVSGMRLDDLDLDLQMDAGLQDTVARLSRMSLGIRSGLNPGGNVDASGSYDLNTGQGRVEFKVANLNQHALGPVLASALAPRRLETVAVSGSGTADVALQGASKVNVRMTVSDLKAAEPSGDRPIGPLGLELAVTAGAQGAKLDLGEVRLGLGKTERADNELTVGGILDLSPTNAVPSTLQVRSTGLDLTPLYELFAGGSPSEPAKTPAPPSAGAEPAGDGAEPAPVELPFRRLTVDLDVARLYLREVELADWKARVDLDNGRVVVRPFALSLNGAPVSADVDANLAVPGYQYQVGFDAKALPLPPLVNSFVPDRRGQIAGTAGAHLKVSGAGITGANLERNLQGDFGLVATNLNLQVADVRTPVVKTVVNLVLGLPSLIRSASNPAAFLESLAGRLTGQAPGWVDEFTKSPIDALLVSGQAGGGKVNLAEARVISPAFLANAGGTVTLKPVLTNSPIAIPVRIALREDLARQVGVRAEAQAGYASLPDFVSLAGTLGEPKADVDKSKLLLMGGQAALGLAGGAVESAGGAVGNVLNAVKGLVDGPAASTNTPGTQTNKSGIGGLLKALGGGEKPADTNAPAAPKSNPLDILGIGKPRK